MKNLKWSITFLMVFAGSLFFTSCSKDDDNGKKSETNKPIVHEDPDNYYEYTVTGALTEVEFGKPSWILFAGNLSTFRFGPLRLDANFKYDDDEENNGHMTGIETMSVDGSWTATPGTYPILYENIKFDEDHVSFRAYYKKSGSDREFGGGGDDKSVGELVITESGYRYYEGTFDFVIYEREGPEDSFVNIKGHFRQKL